MFKKRVLTSDLDLVGADVIVSITFLSNIVAKLGLFKLNEEFSYWVALDTFQLLSGKLISYWATQIWNISIIIECATGYCSFRVTMKWIESIVSNFYINRRGGN